MHFWEVLHFLFFTTGDWGVGSIVCHLPSLSPTNYSDIITWCKSILDSTLYRGTFLTGVCQAGQSINWYNQTKMKLQITFRAVRGDKLLIEASNIPQPSSVLSTNQNQLKAFSDKRADGETGDRADQGHHHVDSAKRGK